MSSSWLLLLTFAKRALHQESVTSQSCLLRREELRNIGTKDSCETLTRLESLYQCLELQRQHPSVCDDHFGNNKNDRLKVALTWPKQVSDKRVV